MILLLPACFLPACFLVPPDSAAPTESPAEVPLTVADLRADPATGQEGTFDVIAQSGVFLDGSSFYVADPAGGPRSGLRIWSDEGFSRQPHVGDRIFVGGTYQIVDGGEALVTAGGTISRDGEGEPLPPSDLPIDWTEAESGLVRVPEVTASILDGAGVATLALVGVEAPLRLEPTLFLPDVRCRRSWSAITGFLAETPTGWALRPRDAADLEGAVEPERLPATLGEVQSGVCGPVVVSGMVSSPAATVDGVTVFFLATEGGIGLQVEADAALDAPAEGDVLTIEGEAGESGSHSRLVAVAWSVGATAAAVVPATPTLPVADWSAWDGALVTLTDVGVTEAPLRGAFSTDAGLVVQDLFYAVPATEGDRLPSLTGIVYDAAGTWSLAPRSAADVVP